MKTILILIVAGLCALVLIIRKILMWQKKPLRKGELKRHIAAILDPNGSSESHQHFQQALHIVEHYGVTLKEAGYDGTIGDLNLEASKSMVRYKKREESDLTARSKYNF